MLCDSNSLTPIRCLYPLEYFQYVVKSQVNFGCRCLPYFIFQSGTHTRNWCSTFCIYHRRISDLSERLYCTSGRELHRVPSRIHCTMGCSILWVWGQPFQLSWDQGTESPLQGRGIPLAQLRRTLLLLEQSCILVVFLWIPAHSIHPYSFKWLWLR